MLTILVILILLNVLAFVVKASVTGAAKADASPSASPPAAPEHCGDARRAIRYYQRQERRWRGKMGAGVALRAPLRKNGADSCSHIRHLAKVWHQRATASRSAYLRWADRQVQVVIDRLERGLRGTPMSGTGRSLERWGRVFHVSPYFMAAVAGTESTFGEAACSSNHYNVWGLASCGVSWSVPAFGSWDEAIHFYAHFLSSHWPRHSTPYSFIGYARSVSSWGTRTSYFMRERFGVSNSTRYP